MLWVVAGTVLGILDQIVRLLINLQMESVIRAPAGESLYKFIDGSFSFLTHLMTTGLEPGLAVQFCATRLAGVDPRYMRIGSGTNDASIIGYWNGQQGILVTPVFELCLYYDLPLEKSRPLTLFNIPIEGMPTDDGGWIRPGTVPAPLMKRLQKVHVCEPSRCSVILEYRPHFELDSDSVVAAAYVDGVFFDLLNMGGLLSHYWHEVSRCNHQDVPSEEPEGQGMRYIDLKDLTSGEIGLPDDNDKGLVVCPQPNDTSRLFSTIVYRSSKPIVQKGCLVCAAKVALNNKGSVIVPSCRMRRVY